MSGFGPINFAVGCAVTALFVVLGWFLINHQLDNENRRHIDQGRQMQACIAKIGAETKPDVQICRATVYGTR